MRKIMLATVALAAGMALAEAGGADHAFSTLRLPGIYERDRAKWPAYRDMLARSRDCFDELWFSAGTIYSLERHAEIADWMEKAVGEARKLGFRTSVEYELTIGNDDPCNGKKAAFRTWTGFTGPEGLEGVECNCPRDPNFHEYFRKVVEMTCRWHPEVAWLDDDVRVENHGRNSDGCYCARCLKAFSEKEGKAWTREALVAAKKADAGLARRWRTHCFDGLAVFAYEWGKAVKRVSPKTRLGFQYPWADEGQNQIVAALVKAAGEPIEMRPGCCNYFDRNPFDQIDKTYRMALQVKTLDKCVGAFSRLCPEIETYPRTFTCRGARSLGFEALIHLANGLDSLTWYITCMEEKPEFFERSVFAAPRQNMWLYKEYVKLSDDSVPCGFDTPDYSAAIGQWSPNFCAPASATGIPYAFGRGVKIGTVLWDFSKFRALTDETLKSVLAGPVIADLPAVRELVKRSLLPAEAAELSHYRLSDSTESRPKACATPQGGKLAVFKRLDSLSETSATHLSYAHLADEVCGGKLPVLVEDPAMMAVFPRVFADGSFATAVFVNTRIDEQEPVRVRLRNFKGDAARWFALWSKDQKPLTLPVTRDAATGDALVTLPALGVWSGGFLAR